MFGVYNALIDNVDDKRAFEKLVKTYENRLFSCAKKILRDDDLAEEAVWDAFLAISKCFKKVNSLSMHKLEAYLILTIKNASFALYNREKRFSREISIDDLLSEEIPTVDDLERFDYDELKYAINELDERYRSALTYYVVYGFTADEIAELMGISRRAVYRYIYLAKVKIKETVIENGNKKEKRRKRY